MSTTTIQTIIDRASSDPDFLKRLSKDPEGTARAEGYEVTYDEVRALLDMPHASDKELAEALQARLNHDGSGFVMSALTSTTP